MSNEQNSMPSEYYHFLKQAVAALDDTDEQKQKEAIAQLLAKFMTDLHVLASTGVLMTRPVREPVFDPRPSSKFKL